MATAGEKENSRWLRADKMAERPDNGGRVLLTENGWIFVLGRRMKRLVGADEREDAIEQADQFLPPGQWGYNPKDFTWYRKDWEVRYDAEGWQVWRTDPQTGDMTQASVTSHPSADRARRWVELRLERTGGNLRGPLPRAGQASTAKLPDIRVTPEEREQAFELLKQLGLSYASFVRAALHFAEEHLDGGMWQVVKTGSECRFEIREEVNVSVEEVLEEMGEDDAAV